MRCNITSHFLALLLLTACPGTEPPDTQAPMDDTGPGDTDTGVPATVISAAALAAADEVSQANVEAFIRALEALGTRYTGTEGEALALALLSDQLEGFGLTPEQDSFSLGGEQPVNLVARKDGAERPERVWIFSAHYDSTSQTPQTYAPGADDNASGVAAVLEAARILAPMELRDSVWFVLTAAEEQGSRGSEHMAEWLLDDEIQVQGVIAPDMIGYWPAGDADAFDILGDDGSEHLVASMAEVADHLGVAHKTWSEHRYCYGDDHTNFQEAGFPAISPMDCVEAHNVSGSGETLPHYHKTTDTIDTLHLPFTTQVVRVIVATLAHWAEPA